MGWDYSLGFLSMLFMVIERFKDGKAKEIYRRFQEKGRMMPEGLKYLDSWVEVNFGRCFQLMECDDLCLLQEWILQWQDLGEFEIVPVVPSKETAEVINRQKSLIKYCNELQVKKYGNFWGARRCAPTSHKLWYKLFPDIVNSYLSTVKISHAQCPNYGIGTDRNKRSIIVLALRPLFGMRR